MDAARAQGAGPGERNVEHVALVPWRHRAASLADAHSRWWVQLSDLSPATIRDRLADDEHAVLAVCERIG
jgi:hypothetical protein